ncbi:PilN domain-containing protein [Clostridium botulinum]|uniref:PilN domain-containing protein n=1 Tax=unclassified Clostridium TaxID=2614128 RepID=UPI000506761E|nr:MULTISPECIES: PilN domain-containing protein [unclassified Clostridium]KFX57566.1 fimbrial protein [Clostridium botulinum]KFX59743.1 fimbrial protein [Clostridium botulinum]MBY6779164.1 PilN domain-containing protein [Clostridium botulinum]MBY6801944.1 PilN domain-containing protein [Clostridium botulinum]MBY6812084.1 PilN domain-containing protein [Clostridium botulinum]
MRDINFFSPYQGKNQEKKNAMIYIYGAMGVVGALIIITLIFNTTRILLLNRSISNYNEKLNTTEIQEKFAEAQKVNNEIEILTKYDSALNDVLGKVNSRNNVSDLVLTSINSTIPSQISFKTLQINNDILIIQGISSSRDAVGEFQHNLKELSIINDVFVNSIDIDGALEGNYSFDIKCILKEVNLK